MSNKLKNLPPEVVRELMRHVKKPSRPTATITNTSNSTSSGSASSTSKSSTTILLACTAFVGCAATLPYWATKSIGNLTDRDEALTAAQVRRGAFLNSGSKDAGKDPNWDWKNGKYVYPKGFAEHLKRQNPNETDFGPDIGPMVREQQQKQQEQSRP